MYLGIDSEETFIKRTLMVAMEKFLKWENGRSFDAYCTQVAALALKLELKK